jgi:hypothetical protein
MLRVTLLVIVMTLLAFWCQRERVNMGVPLG